MAMDKISIKGLELWVFCGCLPEEKERRQLFLVDMELELDLKKAKASDELADTFDYRRAFEIAKKVMAGSPRNLIESAAEEILQGLLACEEITWARVTLHKPTAPLEYKFADLAVTVEGRR